MALHPRKCFAQNCVLCDALQDRDSKGRMKVKDVLPYAALQHRGSSATKATQSSSAKAAQLNDPVPVSRKPPVYKPPPSLSSHAAIKSAVPVPVPKPAAKARQPAKAKDKKKGGRDWRADIPPGGTLSAELYQELMNELQHREITPEDYDLLLRLDDTVPKKDVLSAAEVANALAQRLAESTDDECPICASEFEPTEMVAVLSCGHVYHSGCVQNWLTMGRNTCPMCGQCAACQSE